MDSPQLTPAPAGQQLGGQRLARISALPWLLFIAALGLAAWLGWQAYGPRETGDPLATSLIAFERQNRLTVFSAELAPVVSSDDARLFGLVRSRQVAVIPARVDYTLDLSKVGRDRLKWNAQTHTLAVTLPPVTIRRPNLDEARARYLLEGVWITREAQDKLTRDNTKLAEQLAMEQAANPVLLDLARNSARIAVQQNLAIPLSVAGYGEVTVTVRFDGEPTTP